MKINCIVSAISILVNLPRNYLLFLLEAKIPGAFYGGIHLLDFTRLLIFWTQRHGIESFGWNGL